MLTFSIDTPLFHRFPALSVGGFVAGDLDKAASLLRKDELEAEWATAAAALASHGVTLDNVENVSVIRSWRQTFAACGVEPRRYRASVESIAVAALQQRRCTARGPIAALCSALSARYLAPIAGHDVDALPDRSLCLRRASPNSDWFVPLGARPTELPLTSEVVVYAAGETVLSWSFNHRDSRQTCLDTNTTRAVFFSEATVARHRALAERALLALRRALRERGARVGAPAFADAHAPFVYLHLSDEADHD